jgi:hypothetical protein
MRHAYALIEAGSLDAGRAAHWRRVVVARNQFAEQARERAAEQAARYAYESLPAAA